jgi:hypothetical protein
MTRERIDLPEPGCLLDGRFGNDFNTARIVAMAAEHGMRISPTDRDRTARVLRARFTESELTDDESEPFTDLGHSAEAHLNSIAPEDHRFGFWEGDFMYMPTEWWGRGGVNRPAGINERPAAPP